MRNPRLSQFSLFPVLVVPMMLMGCEKPDVDVSGLEPIAHCVYVNPFSELEECREYLGEGWDVDSAEDDCNGQDGSAFSDEGGCTYEGPLGACIFDGDTDRVYQVVIPNIDSTCEEAQRGCEIFGGGQFEPFETCGGLPDNDLDQGKLSDVFVQPELSCVEPNDDVTGQSEDGKVCTWQAIGACTEEGRAFEDYGSCEVVRSQRPYYPYPQSEFVTDENDPILDDDAFRTELDWVVSQVKSCGCVCCHTTGAPSGPSNWFLE
jgi:hypothetical protein